MFESVGTKNEKCDKAQVTGHEHFRQTLCVLRGECVHSCKYDSVLVCFLKQFTMKENHFFKKKKKKNNNQEIFQTYFVL